jgi:glycosyltransferase involved in cell wall biosynthesis
MRVGLIAPPFIAVPPRRYGGTELFIARLAEALVAAGHQVTVYANGESRPAGRLRALYGEGQWPIVDAVPVSLRELNHSAWAVEEAIRDGLDVLHVNTAQALVCARFAAFPCVCTLHHPQEPNLSELYSHYPDVHYVAISEFQRRHETMPRITTIHHGLNLAEYQFVERKQPYVAFLGRICPVKGAHVAIDVARRLGVPLKLAGEVQPIHRDYWETAVRPHVDGRLIEYLGEADLATKNELLGNAAALLFPIQWNEPFGLVMIEAMACGTPVLALAGGSVAEIVRDGASGWICRDADDMVRRLAALDIAPASCRRHVEDHFRMEVMGRRYERVYRRAIEDRSVVRRLTVQRAAAV